MCTKYIHISKVVRLLCTDEAFKLFDSLVLSILCYSSEIWGNDYSETIEKVHAEKYM